MALTQRFFLVRFIREEIIFFVWSDGLVLAHTESSGQLVTTRSWEQGEKGYGKKERDPTSFRRHVAFPSRQLLQVPGSPVVCPCRNVLGRVATNPRGLPFTCFRITTAIPAPWAQQAFTRCADLDDGSALFFGWSEPYSRHASIYAFVEKFQLMHLVFVEKT